MNPSNKADLLQNDAKVSAMIRGMILDFDGIILESVELKGEAFKILFKDFPDHQDRIYQYHMENGGVSRTIKIRHIYKEFLHEPLSEEKYQELCQEYSRIALDLVLKCPFVPGAKEFLEDISKRCPLFVISGTPHEEIRFIVEELQLNSYFKAVYGSPTSKGEWTKKIMETYGFKANDLFWVGDSMSDFDAARDHGVRFIERRVSGKDALNGHRVFHRVKDMSELRAFVQDYL